MHITHCTVLFTVFKYFNTNPTNLISIKVQLFLTKDSKTPPHDKMKPKSPRSEASEYFWLCNVTTINQTAHLDTDTTLSAPD